MAIERYPEALPTLLLDFSPLVDPKLKSLLADAWIRTVSHGGTDGETIVEELLAFWMLVVATYSMTCLTGPTDKLVALSGVAKWMKVVMRDDYIVGLWRTNLAAQLLWPIGN